MPVTILVAPRVGFTIGPTVDIGVGGSASASAGGASISADQRYTDIGGHAGLLLFL